MLQDTLHVFNSPALLFHTSSTALQAAQACFLGPQAQVSLPAESSWPPPEQRGMGECPPVTRWRNRETTPLCSCIVLEKPKSCAITWLPMPRAGSPAQNTPESISSCNHSILCLGTGALGTEGLTAGAPSVRSISQVQLAWCWAVASEDVWGWSKRLSWVQRGR